MNIEIRQATINELDLLVPLFDQYRVFYNKLSDEGGARQFLFDRFEHHESVIFIACDKTNNSAFGFTQLYPKFSSVSMRRVWLLNDLFVAEEHRQLGIASGLLAAAKKFALATNAKGIELSTSIENKTAQHLYEAQGYKKDLDFYTYFLSLTDP